MEGLLPRLRRHHQADPPLELVQLEPPKGGLP